METSMTTPLSTALRHELAVEEVIAQVQKIQQVMEAVMQENEHYGVIPGTQKPTLLKPGAEKLCLTFRLDPQYDSHELYDGKHLTVKSKCTLWHIPTSLRMGSGEGSCSTKEEKYAYRQAARLCPACHKEAIIRGKKEYGGGWLCFKKKDGCGAKFADGDKLIEDQPTGKVPNEQLPDQYNTVLKMADKRALVAAVLNVTAASDLFTQDMEDFADTKKPPENGREDGAGSPTVGAPLSQQASDAPASSHADADVNTIHHDLLAEAVKATSIDACNLVLSQANQYDFSATQMQLLNMAVSRRMKELKKH